MTRDGSDHAYRTVEHVGEVELELEAAAPAGLFAAALEAFARLVDTGEPGEPDRHDVTLAAPDPGLLLVAWLEELVYLAETERFVPLRADRLDVDAGRLSASVAGLRATPLHLVKAVTLHDLEVVSDGGTWHGRVVLDV